MNIIEKLAEIYYDKCNQGIDIKKLKPAEQIIYLTCIKHFVQNKRLLLQEYEPDLEQYSDEHLINDFVELIAEGIYFFFIADTNNFVVIFKHQDEYKLMHVVEGGDIAF